MSNVKLFFLLVFVLLPLQSFAQSSPVTSATLDVYASINSDGYIYADGSDVASARLNSSGSARTHYMMFAGIGSYNYGVSTTPMTYRVNRAFLSFPTAALPDNGRILSAALRFRALPIIKSDEHTYLALAEANPANPQQLSSSDFSSIGNINALSYYSDEVLTKTDTLYDISHSDGYSEFVLNESAKDRISSSPFISFAILDGHDIEGITPLDIGTVFSQSLIAYRWEMNDTPQPGSYYGYYPYLHIVYSTTTANTPPTFTLPPTTTVFEGSTLTFDASATDPDGDTLTYTATNLPSGATYNATTGELSWTPGYSDAGTYTLELTATDDGQPVMSASTTLTIAVLNANRAPILNPIGNQTVTEGETLSFTIAATDPDNDTLTYTAPISPLEPPLPAPRSLGTPTSTMPGITITSSSPLLTTAHQWSSTSN